MRELTINIDVEKALADAIGKELSNPEVTVAITKIVDEKLSWMTAAQVAAHLKVSVGTVRKLGIPHTGEGRNRRYHIRDVRACIEAHLVHPGSKRPRR